MSRIGRPTLLTPAIAKAIVAHIEEGCPLDVAAELEGIYRRRAEEWLARGRAEDAPEPYASFARSVTRARAAVVKESLLKIRDAHYETKNGDLRPDVRAQQWYAERVLGYDPRTRVVTESAEQPIDDSPESVEAAVRVLRIGKGA